MKDWTTIEETMDVYLQPFGEKEQDEIYL